MIVGFDARFIRPHQTGVGWYTENLLRGLSSIPLDFSIYAFTTIPLSFKVSPHIIETRATDYQQHPTGEFWQHLYLPFFLKRHSITIYHSPAFYLPVYSFHCRRIVTIHDLAIFRHPSFFPRAFRLYFQRIIRTSIRAAHRILASSEFTRQEIQNVFPGCSVPIDVVPIGVDPVFTAQGGQGATDYLEQTYHLKKKYILFVGTLEPRKNISVLIQAFQSLMSHNDNSFQLVIVGSPGWNQTYNNMIFSLMKTTPDIIHLGYVPQNDLVFLYRNAQALVYPSLYEGFGIPIIEAFACGCPVITAHSSACAEIAGSAAILIDPNNPNSISQAVLDLDANPDQCVALRESGFQRLLHFRWHSIIRSLVSIYEEEDRLNKR